MKKKTLLLLLVVSFPVFSQQAIDFKLQDSHGQDITLSDYRGKVVLLDFWASWCIPCRKSFPWMNAIQKKYQKQGLKVVAVNLDKEDEERERFLKQFPADFTVLIDRQGQTPALYHVTGMPTSILISRSGEVVSRHIGFRHSKTEDYETQIVKLLKQ